MCLFVDKARLSICITNLNFSKLWGFLSPWSIFLSISFSTLNRTDQTFIFLLVFVKDLVHRVVTNYLNEVWRQWHWQRGDSFNVTMHEFWRHTHNDMRRIPWRREFLSFRRTAPGVQVVRRPSACPWGPTKTNGYYQRWTVCIWVWQVIWLWQVIKIFRQTLVAGHCRLNLYRRWL